MDSATGSPDSAAAVAPTRDSAPVFDSGTSWPLRARDVAAVPVATGAVSAAAAAVDAAADAAVDAVAVAVAGSASSRLTFGRIATGCRGLESHVADFAGCAEAWAGFRAP